MPSENARPIVPLVRRQSWSVYPAMRSQFECRAPVVFLTAAFGPLVPYPFIDPMIGPPAMW